MQLAGQLSTEAFTKKNNELVLQKQTLESQLHQIKSPSTQNLNGLEELIKLLENPVYAYHQATPKNKQALIEKMMTNITFGPGTFDFEWQTPFELLAKRKPQERS